MEKLKRQLEMSVIAIPIGIITGILCALFGIVLLKLSDFRDMHKEIILFLPIAGLFIMFVMDKVAGISAKGMNLVFSTGHGDEGKIPLLLIPVVTITTWITHLFGGSAGREGVAIQIGATVSHNFAVYFRKDLDSKAFVVMGMAAGFSGLFGTPVAAVFFAMEVLIAGDLYIEALIPSLIAALFAKGTSQYLGLEGFHNIIEESFKFSTENIFKLIVISIIFGITGGLFAYALKNIKKKLSVKFSDNMKKIFFGAIPLMLIIYFTHYGRYAGLGTNLIAESMQGNGIYNYDFILKFLITVFTLVLGFQGGEVTPIFAIGATLGFFLATVFNLPVTLIAALGYAAVFSSATNTFIGPIFIGAEVFGYHNIPLFIIVCLISYLTNGGQSIYTLQKKKRFVKLKGNF